MQPNQPDNQAANQDERNQSVRPNSTTAQGRPEALEGRQVQGEPAVSPAKNVVSAPPVDPVAGSAATVLPAPHSAPPSTSPPNPNSTQNSLHISEIRDGIVIMDDGTFRAVVLCQSINFDLMSPDEREAVEYSYQGFLNSLYFPIQIYMRSEKIDLSSYLRRLDKRRVQQENMLLGMLMQDYIGFLGQISQETNIMDKKFYIVIGYPDANADIRRAFRQSTGFFRGVLDLFRPGKAQSVTIDESLLEKAKTELRNRVNAVMQGLTQCGVKSVPLDTQELIELYYEAYNPETALNQRLADAGDLNIPLVKKGKGQAPSPSLDGETT